jgi:hypothetical protein
MYELKKLRAIKIIRLAGRGFRVLILACLEVANTNAQLTAEMLMHA